MKALCQCGRKTYLDTHRDYDGEIQICPTCEGPAVECDCDDYFPQEPEPKGIFETPLDRRALYDLRRVIACIRRRENEKLAKSYPGMVDPFDNKPIKLSPWNSSFETIRLAKVLGYDHVTRGRVDRLAKLKLIMVNDRFDIYQEDQNEVA